MEDGTEEHWRQNVIQRVRWSHRLRNVSKMHNYWRKLIIKCTSHLFLKGRNVKNEIQNITGVLTPELLLLQFLFVSSCFGHFLFKFSCSKVVNLFFSPLWFKSYWVILTCTILHVFLPKKI